MKRLMKSILNQIKQVFNTEDKLSLKDCYQVLLFFVFFNFMLIVFWAINPFGWHGIISYLWDGLMIIYALLMMILVSSTLIRRFKDAQISPSQAFIFPLAMTIIFVIVRIRLWTQTIIITLLVIYFLSHFYLIMLAVMPSQIHEKMPEE